MKLSNFTLIRVKGSNRLDKEFFAEVDVTTGILWWKKTRRVVIRREFGGYWHFAETGEFTPGFQVERLARAWTAITGQET